MFPNPNHENPIKVSKQKLTAWQREHPYPGHKGREAGFILQSAAKWLKSTANKAAPNMLFDNFWFEKELCIMFADTNTGKSVLAVQIADSISRGVPVNGLELTARPCGVLYFDYELTDEQFHTRFTRKGKDTYQFDKRFSRAVTNPLADKMHRFGSYQQYIENEIENALLTANAKVLIIDNISCLNFDTHALTGAINLLRSLHTIKNKYGISILVLAHTPKRNPTKPISRNDLQGSKMLINFCDSAFAIGESRVVPGLRYLKQIKQRSTIQQYGAENVCLFHLHKQGNFLQFIFTGRAAESAHLLTGSRQYHKSIGHEVEALSRQQLSIRQIAVKLNLAPATVGRMVKRMNT